MNEEEPEFEIEQEWSKIKEMYSSTCEEVLGKAKREQKAWISENTWRLVEEKRVVKAKLEAAKTRQQKLATVERYNEKNHEVKRSCRRDKRQRIDEIARERGSCRTKRHEESLRYHKTAQRAKDCPEQTCNGRQKC